MTWSDCFIPFHVPSIKFWPRSLAIELSHHLIILSSTPSSLTGWEGLGYRYCLELCTFQWCFFHKRINGMKICTFQVPLPPADERKKVVEDVDKDRRYAIDACIVRIMKSRKVLPHQQLVLECVEQLSRMFKVCTTSFNHLNFLEWNKSLCKVYMICMPQ